MGNFEFDKQYEVADRYARALIQISSSKKQISERAALLDELANLLRKNAPFRCFILNPEISTQKKEAIFLKAIDDTDIVAFLMLLIQKKKLAYLSVIAQKFHNLSLAHNNMLEVTLVTAMPVNADLKKYIIKTLEKTYHKSVVLAEKIESDLVGGAILFFENQILDMSLTGDLKRMQSQLLRKNKLGVP